MYVNTNTKTFGLNAFEPNLTNFLSLQGFSNLYNMKMGDKHKLRIVPAIKLGGCEQGVEN
jgi:hypothetical protein